MKDQYNFKSLVLAQKGDVKGVREILNKHTLNFFEKALIFAILNERDSMYYYLDKEKNIILINLFNSRKEVDPYRKEEKYKEYLKNNYLPVTHWNE